MLLPHGAIVAVVDGHKFDLFRNSGNEAEPDLVSLPEPRLDTRNHSGAGHRSSTGNHADSLVDEDAHAIAVTEWLNGEVLGHRIAHLVVIAAPRTLGEMRRHYRKQLRDVLIEELAKDLSGRSGPEIVAALRAKS
jgi:protein required for attachment to host cells